MTMSVFRVSQWHFMAVTPRGGAHQICAPDGAHQKGATTAKYQKISSQLY